MADYAPLPAFPDPDAAPPARGQVPRDPRTNTMLAATIGFAGYSADVFLRDVSTTGALVEGPRLPAVGEDLLLERGSVQVRATVIWQQERRCGIRFAQPVSVPELMRRVGVGTSAQQARAAPPPRRMEYVPPAAAGPGAAAATLRAELGYACRLSEAAGQMLGSDAYVKSRYGPALAKLEELRQLLRKLEGQAGQP